jgi:hypothetical protein
VTSHSISIAFRPHSTRNIGATAFEGAFTISHYKVKIIAIAVLSVLISGTVSFLGLQWVIGIALAGLLLYVIILAIAVEERAENSPIESILYRVRCKAICLAVVGKEFYQLDDQADLVGWSTPEQVRLILPLERRKFELFRRGYERLRSHPEQYEQVVTWGSPRPGLMAGLFEAHLNTVDDYPNILSNHVENLRNAGQTAEADTCEAECQEVIRFLNDLHNSVVQEKNNLKVSP